MPAIAMVEAEVSDLASQKGEDLKALRKAVGLSQSEVARRLGVDVATVSRWERGAVKNMRSENMGALAQIYRVPIDVMAHMLGLGPEPVLSTEDQARALPRQLRKMATDFEKEALALGASAEELRSIRYLLYAPENVALYLNGHDGAPLPAAEQRLEMETAINATRNNLRRRIKAARAGHR